MSTATTFRRSPLLLILSLAVANLAMADGDHALVGRYEGADLVGHMHSKFDEANLISGPIVGSSSGEDKRGWIRVEGVNDLYYYKLPEGHSPLEVLRNYQASLKSKGFETVFTCATSDGSCYAKRPGHVDVNDPYGFGGAIDGSPELPRLDGDYIRNYFTISGRYLLGKLSRPQGAVYASIAFAEGVHGNFAFVRVVEITEMDSHKITFVDAAQMQDALSESGRISLYGIQFDFDKDVITPDSKPIIDEIAKLLNSEAALRLRVVGHTDAKGSANYNTDLSKRRAASVVKALLSDYGIDASRLVPNGVGASEPLAANDTEEGRAMNRRVELVRQ